MVVAKVCLRRWGVTEVVQTAVRAALAKVLRRVELCDELRRDSKAVAARFSRDDLTKRCPGSSADTFQEYSFA